MELSEVIDKPAQEIDIFHLKNPNGKDKAVLFFTCHPAGELAEIGFYDSVFKFIIQTEHPKSNIKQYDCFYFNVDNQLSLIPESFEISTEIPYLIEEYKNFVANKDANFKMLVDILFSYFKDMLHFKDADKAFSVLKI